MNSPPKTLGNFGVSHYLCPPDTSLIQFLDASLSAGYTSIGLTERALSELPIATISRELRARDMTVSSVNTAGYFLYRDERRAKQDKINEYLLQAASELEVANGVNLIVGGNPTVDLVTARAFALEKSGELALRAAELGTRLLLEPMHPTQVTGKGCVNTLAQAFEWTGLIDGLFLNLDLYHSWWDPDLARTLDGDMAPLGVVQICDVAFTPESQISSRVPLTEGKIDWGRTVAFLVKHKPNIPIELELFESQLTGRDGLDLLAQNARHIRSFLQGKIA
jgi:sugar phosphate isomerase/epimerase